MSLRPFFLILGVLICFGGSAHAACKPSFASLSKDHALKATIQELASLVVDVQNLSPDAPSHSLLLDELKRKLMEFDEALTSIGATEVTRKKFEEVLKIEVRKLSDTTVHEVQKAVIVETHQRQEEIETLIEHLRGEMREMEAQTEHLNRQIKPMQKEFNQYLPEYQTLSHEIDRYKARAQWIFGRKVKRLELELVALGKRADEDGIPLNALYKKRDESKEKSEKLASQIRELENQQDHSLSTSSPK